MDLHDRNNSDQVVVLLRGTVKLLKARVEKLEAALIHLSTHGQWGQQPLRSPIQTIVDEALKP